MNKEKKEKRDSSELFYSFFSSIKPRQPKNNSIGDEWKSHVLPHSEIEELAPNLSHLTGTLPSSTMVPREMIIYRLADSSLLIHSAIALNESGMAKLESLGTPKILIVPNRIHRLDANVFKHCITIVARPKTEQTKQSKPIRDAEATQAVILTAAEAEFAQHGFTAARTEAIAAKTGVAKSMIYYYFKDKEGLYQKVLERSHADLLATVRQLELENLSALVALEKFLQALLDCVSRNPKLPTIMFHEAVQNQGKFYQKSSSLSIDTVLIEILEKGVNTGEFRHLDSFQSAINIMGICLFYFIGVGNIKQHPQGKKLLSKAMLEQHKQEAIAFILAGVRQA
jgi:TetR/AcrR family transcriptional regulator